MTKVVLVARKYTPTDEIYIINPLTRLLNSKELDFRVITTDRISIFKRLKAHSIISSSHIIVSRSIPKSWIDFLSTNRSSIRSFHYLFDDDFSAAKITPTTPQHYHKRLLQIADEEFPRLTELSDSVIVTSRYLKDKYNSPKTTLLEPAAHMPQSNLSHHDNTKTIKIVYYATAVHSGDLQMISPTLKRLHDNYQHITIDIITGRHKPKLLSNLPRISVRRQISWPKYKKFMQGNYAHIVLIPLLDSPFNRGKSIIKFFDVCTLGAVGIYSDVCAYNDVVSHGSNGLLVSNHPEDWFNAISGLIENPERMKYLAEEGQKHARIIGDPSRLDEFWARTLKLSS